MKIDYVCPPSFDTKFSELNKIKKSNTCNNAAPTTSDEIIGINGIPKPKSLLSSFLFSRLSSPAVTDKQIKQQQQQQQQQQHQQQQQQHQLYQKETEAGLQSSALPTCLLGEHSETMNDGDNSNNDNAALRSRTVTDDANANANANADAAPTPMLGNSGVLLLPRPSRSWNISNDDRKLPKVPEYYYPHLFDPNCTALVTDSPPSIVVVRISECLRRRSIAVEYDDDSVTAKCMTIDRTHFIVQLYRSSSSTTTTTALTFNGGEQQQQQYENNGHDITMMTGTGSSTNGVTNISSSSLLCPPNDSIIVECRKTSGDSMSFHAACYKILMAAKGLDNGNDERPSHRMNGLEFRPELQRPKLKRSYPASSTTTTPSSSKMSMTMKRRKLPLPNTDYESASDESTRYYSIVENNNNSSNTNNNNASYGEALEAALDLLEKDRLDCQQSGMERLVHLTTRNIVGKESSSYISKRLLQQGNGDNSASSSIEKNSNNNNEGNRWRLIDCLMHPGAEQVSELELPGEGGLGGEGRKSLKKNSNNSSNSYNETYTTQMIRSFLESSAPPAITPSPAKKNHNHHHQRHQSLSSSLSPFSRGQSFLRKKSSTTASATTHNRRSSSSDIIDNQKIAQDHYPDDQDQLSPDELRHEAKLRSLALRVFCNALENLSKTKELHDILYPNNNNNNSNNNTISAKRKGQQSNNIPSTSTTTTTTTRWIRPAFLLSLVQDLQGAARPPSVSETGYKLASVHEAALAVRSLRLLSGYHSADTDEIDENNADDEHNSSPQSRVRDFLRSEAVLERLEYARSCGRATHAVLQYEAECIYNRLTEDVRSC